MLVIFILLLVGNIPSGFGKHKHEGSHGDFQQLVNKLWNLDTNRVKFKKDFDLSYQGHAVNGQDNAPKHLFSKMDTSVLNRPTYKAFAALLDNYNRIEGKAEDITSQEIAENNIFLDLVLKSNIMQEVYSYLKKKGKASYKQSKFRSKLYRLWFGPYGRSRHSGVEDSSGFEHVFVGEINGRKHNIGGFHNWIRLYEEEKKNHLNYLGYLKKLENPLIFNFRFKWYNVLKPLGSSFFGTSPEFEMSLYTAVYMMGYNHITIKLNGIKLHITCWPINGGKNIGTCYPSIL